MTDITEHSAQVVVRGYVAANGATDVDVVFPQFSTVIEGAVVVANTANAVPIKTTIDELTLTISPDGNDAGAGYYKVIAWGY